MSKWHPPFSLVGVYDKKANGLGLLSFFARKKAMSATPAVLEAIGARQFNPYPALGGTNLSRDRINSVYVQSQSASYAWIYGHTPAVRRVVDYIAKNISQLGVKVYERVSDDERRHVGDHPAARALRNPNPQTPGARFIEQFVVDHLVYGNAYALKFRAAKGGLTLINIPPHMVGLVGQSYFSVDAYRIYRADGSAFDRPPEDVIHWRGTSGGDPRKGESLLETLREELAADAASRQATTELYRSGLTPHGWIERPLEAPEISAEGVKRLSEDLANQAKVSVRRWPILEEGMQLKQAGVTPEDAELRDTRKFTMEYVASLYGMKNVPPETEEERKQFYADVLPPLTEMCSSFFDLQILIQEYDAEDYYFEFGREKLLDEVYKTMTSASGRPVLLTNEARAKVDLPPVPDGDELVTPQNVTVGGKPSPMVMPIQDPNKPPQDGSHRTEDTPTPPGKSLNGNSKRAPLVPRRARQDARRDGWAGQYEEKFSSNFARQRQAALSKTGTVKAKAEKVTDVRRDKELAADLLEVSRRHLSSEGDHAAFRMASVFDPGQGENWLAVKAAETAKAVNATTRQHIEEQGIADAFAHAIEVRAVAGAMGYATTVGAFANKAAIQQAPDGHKRLVTIDGGDCEICAEFQGSFPAADVPGWPAFHNGCDCIADVS